MRCGCPHCEAYMIQSETEHQACVCPDCGYRCNACLGTNTVITRRQFQFLCLQTKTTAGRIIRRLVEEGKLKNISIPRNPIYVPVDGMLTPIEPSQTQNVK